MYTLLLAVIICVLPFASAQYGAPPSSQSSSAVASAPTAPTAPADTSGHINVDVSFNGSLVYHPANITAPNGTLVTFWFPVATSGIAHSVTQSSFANPCTYLAASGNSSAGFDSGLTAAKHFTINITDDTRPIWFHCKQINHCGLGMVGSINAPTSGNNTYDAFKAAAIAIGSNEKAETDNGPVTGGVNGVATAPPSASTTTGSSGSGKSGAGDKLAASVGLVLFAGALAVTLA